MAEAKQQHIITSIILAAVVGLSGWAWGSVTARVEKTQEVVAADGQRIMKSETEIVAIKDTLQRLETKLDKALERK